MSLRNDIAAEAPVLVPMPDLRRSQSDRSRPRRVCTGNISSTDVGMPSAAKVDLGGLIVSSANVVAPLQTSNAAEKNEKPDGPVLICVQSFDLARPKVFRAGFEK